MVKRYFFAALPLALLAATAQAQTPIRVRYEVGGASHTYSQPNGDAQFNLIGGSGEFSLSEGQTITGVSLGSFVAELSGLDTTVGSRFSTGIGVLSRSLTLRLDDGTTYSGMQEVRFDTLSSTVRTPVPGVLTRYSELGTSVWTPSTAPIGLGDWELEFILNPAAYFATEDKVIQFNASQGLLPGANTARVADSDYTYQVTLRSRVIPEPGAVALLALGGLVGLGLRRRK